MAGNTRMIMEKRWTTGISEGIFGSGIKIPDINSYEFLESLEELGLWISILENAR
jgi:hypothetical protein